MSILTTSLLVCAILALSQATGRTQRLKRQIFCILGWFGYKHRCFHYVPTPMTWAQAEKNCQSLGVNLASIHSSDEYVAVQNIIKRDPNANGPTWIGGSDAQEEGVWFWSDGSSFDYNCGKLRNKSNQDCLQINYEAGHCWDDAACSIRLPSICAPKYLPLTSNK